MNALIKRTIGIALAALFLVMAGHFILDITSDHIVNNSDDFENNSSVAVNK